MRYGFSIVANRIIMRAIGWYISKDMSYSRMYSLNCELKRLSIGPVPGTWLELDWISNFKQIIYHYIN